ncbi:MULTISPECIES: DNA-binding protein [Ramlibacter]|uniref:KfrA N-terminal DNA-binding domain-containing protein n=1 Tax=Ramlibacter pinisoli TaxID=2682844 RepID=A0A6N8INZ5_9BURK|nr:MULTISPECIES: DNA-binding protein [Ramlibacter]MBA2960702.1 DNA-binding protein [Ramlibacter sp. CGMCC 1.13660]MVQ28030.1 hypothetical protein [Ramlibacter pinisoli]
MGKKKGRGRPGITLEDVRRACQELELQGRKVGPSNVRIELGTGSFNTIQVHLRTLGYASRPRRGKG